MILSRPTDERFHCLFDAYRQGFTIDEIAHLTAITPFFLEKIKNIVDMEKRSCPEAAKPTLSSQKHTVSPIPK